MGPNYYLEVVLICIFRRSKYFIDLPSASFTFKDNLCHGRSGRRCRFPEVSDFVLEEVVNRIKLQPFFFFFFFFFEMYFFY